MTRHGSASIDLSTDCEVKIQRAFEAPMSLVFDALTKPEHVRVWFSADGVPLHVCEIDGVFEGRPEAEAVETISLREEDGVTTMTDLLVFKDRASREANFGGDTQGVQSSFNHLGDLLEDLLAGRP